MKKPRFNRWWKLKYFLLGKIPEICPYCGNEVTTSGFKKIRAYKCRSCNMVLVDDYGLYEKNLWIDG